MSTSALPLSNKLPYWKFESFRICLGFVKQEYSKNAFLLVSIQFIKSYFLIKNGWRK